MLPVRKIGRSHRSLRAAHPSAKTGRIVRLESALERDFCYLLEFEPAVKYFVEQPVIIQYELDGNARRYTPDFLVEYIDGRPDTLVEIKYKADLKTDREQLEHKFQAARDYAVTKGWHFKIYTEEEIQTPYLRNVRFLLRFKNALLPSGSDCSRLLLEATTGFGKTTPEKLLQALSPDAGRQIEFLPALWQMVAHCQIGCDLSQPLTMQSQIWTAFELPVSLWIK